MVNLFLSQNVNPNIPGYSKMTPLHISTKIQNNDIVSLLVTNNADCNIPDIDGNTPLHISIMEKCLHISSLLYQFGANLNLKNFKGQTPFHLAAEVGHMGIIKFLFTSGAKWAEKDNNNKTPYNIADEKGFKLIANYIDEYEKIEQWKTTKPKKLSSSIHEAAYNGDLPSLIYHLYHGSNVNQFDSENSKWHIRQSVPLHYASLNNHSEIIKYLKLNGATIDMKNRNSQTPLHFAAENGNLDSVLLLCFYGANVNADDWEYFTPLHKAAMNGHIATYEYLLTYGAKSSKTNKLGLTPIQLLTEYISKSKPRNFENNIHHAAFSGNLESIAYLLFRNNDINIKYIREKRIGELEMKGATPLHFAILGNQIHTVKYLMKYGANPNIATDEGISSVDLASQLDRFKEEIDQKPDISVLSNH